MGDSHLSLTFTTAAVAAPLTAAVQLVYVFVFVDTTWLQPAYITGMTVLTALLTAVAFMKRMIEVGEARGGEAA